MTNNCKGPLKIVIYLDLCINLFDSVKFHIKYIRSQPSALIIIQAEGSIFSGLVLPNSRSGKVMIISESCLYNRIYYAICNVNMQCCAYAMQLVET